MSDVTAGWGFCGMGLSPQLWREIIVLVYSKPHTFLSGPKQPVHDQFIMYFQIGVGIFSVILS